MTSNVSRERTTGGSFGRLRRAALAAVLTGAVGSAALMLYAGRRNDSRLLLTLMAIWVLSPFVVLVCAHVISTRWSVRTRATLYGLMLVVTLGSLAVYGHTVLRPPKAQAAFAFIVVPPASWLFIAIVLPIAAFISGGRSRQGDDA
jgi:hypothetical protein